MISFTVRGTPGPQGSKRMMRHNGEGPMIMLESSPLVAPWRKLVSYEAAMAMHRGKHKPMVGALEVAITFYLRRPRKYYRANGDLKPGAPALVATKPDLSKLVRSTEDAITGICYGDDAQIARLIVEKRYGDVTGADVVIRQAQGPVVHRPADLLLVLAYGAQH